ncbi:MAG: hypothetical protein JJT96_14270 [Opitutales bacterium]|nr:hypothetical protein [Opitutales bacterium]
MKHRKITTCLAPCLALTLFAPMDLRAVEVNASAALSNRYVTEGIDNDPDSSAFLFSEVTAMLEGFTAGVWWAQSLRGSSTNEVNVFLEYGFDLGEVELFAGVNFLTFPALDDADTWEVYLGFAYAPHDNVVFFGETYYDIDEVKGGFLELGAAFPFQPWAADDRWELAPYGQLGVDYGFVSGPRRLRLNNFQIGLISTYTLTDAVEVFAGVHHSFRLRNLRDEELGDVSWVEVGLNFAF